MEHHTCPLNYHAPPNLTHTYFHDVGHRFWSAIDFVEMIAMDEKNPIARVDSVIYLWEQELEKLKAEPFVPKLVKDQLDKLAKECLVEQHAAEITLFAKKSRRITDVGAQHRRVFRNCFVYIVLETHTTHVL